MRASQAIWLVAIICILTGAIVSKNHGEFLSASNPRLTNTLRSVAETYVDYTESMLALENGIIHDLAEEIQSIAQYWEQLLYTTSGALALEKCFYVAMDDWEHSNNDEYKLNSMENLALSIQLTSREDTQTTTTIPSKRIAKKVPATWARPDCLAPGVNNHDELVYILNHKVRTISPKTSASKLHKNGVMIE